LAWVPILSSKSHYPIPPSLFFPFSETEFKRIHVVSPPCKGILDAYSISRLVSQDADDKPRKAEDAQVNRALDGMSAHDKAARKMGKQNHIQLQRRLTKSHNQR
jgi:hypothetical protein